MILTNYVSRKEGGKGLASIEDSVDTSIRRLEDYIKMNQERLMTASRNNADNTRIDRTITRKLKLEEKQFMDISSDKYGKSHAKNLNLAKKGNIKRETESLLIVAQNNTKRTNYVKAKIDKMQQNGICRLCGDRDETINHIISECSKLA